jgi:hypothetical protein
MSPYEKAHRNALDIQDACNFFGVLQSFVRDMEAVREHMHANGTYGSHAFAMHPVAILYIDKLIDLQRRPSDEILSLARDACASITPATSDANPH